MQHLYSKVLKGGIGFIFSNIITKGYQFLLILIAGFYLPPGELGIFVVALTIIQFLQNIISSGISTYLLKFISGNENDNSKVVLGNVIAFALGLTFVFCCTLSFLSKKIAYEVFMSPSLEDLLYILVLSMPFTVLTGLFRSILQSFHRIKLLVATDGMLKISGLLFLLLAFSLNCSLKHIFMVFLFHSMLSLLLCIFCLIYIKFLPKFSFNKDVVIHFAKHAFPFFVINGLSLFGQQSDKLFLGSLASVEEVGIYTIIFTLSMGMMMIHSSFSSVFLPIAAESYKKNNIDVVGQSYNFVSKWVGFANGILFIFLSAFGSDLIKMFGPQYNSQTAYPALIILSGYYYFGTWVGPSTGFLQMYGKQNIEIVNVVLSILVTLLLYFLLIPEYSVIGVSFAILGGGVIRNLLQIIEIKVYLNVWIISHERIRDFILICSCALFFYFIPLEALSKTVFFTVFFLALCIYKIIRLNGEEKAFFSHLLGRDGIN